MRQVTEHSLAVRDFPFARNIAANTIAMIRRRQKG
jgi:hypothetical protein